MAINMLIPHLHFNGTCAEAIALYEKAFNTKTDVFFQSGSGDGSVGHAEMRIHGSRVMLNDRFGAKERTRDCAVAMLVTFGSGAELLACYDIMIMKDGNMMVDPFERAPYTELGGQFVDRFGVQWAFMVEANSAPSQLPMGKLNGLRIIELPKFKAVKSASQPLDAQFNTGGFSAWLKTHGHLVRDAFYASPDFAYHEKDGEATWIWALRDGATAEDCAPYEAIEFAGGLYAVATTDENDGADIAKVFGSMRKWVEASPAFERDDNFENGGACGRYILCHMSGVGLTDALGWAQQEIFLPIRAKAAI
jgi:PhnB protein